MTETTIDRRTTLKVLGGAGVAALAGAGTVTGHSLPSGEENWDVSELESTIVDADPIRDEDPTLTGILVLAGVNQNETVAGLGRTVEGDTAGFWWDPDEGYRAQLDAAVHAVDGDHIAGRTEGDGEIQAAVGHMEPESESFFGEDPALLPSLGGSYSAVYGIAAGDDETVAVGVSTTENGEEEFVQWAIEEADDQNGENGENGGDDQNGENGEGTPDDGEDDQSEQRRLRVHGTDEEPWADYEIVIDGSAEAVGDGEYAANAGDELSEDDGTVTITGTVSSGADTYQFTGEIVDVTDVPGARYTVDGAPFPGPEDDQSGQRILRVEGTDEAQWANYEIYVDGTAEAATEGAYPANADDNVFENDDGTVTLAGTVGSGADTYLFTGEITGWNEAAGARLTVNGEELS